MKKIRLLLLQLVPSKDQAGPSSSSTNKTAAPLKKEALPDAKKGEKKTAEKSSEKKGGLNWSKAQSATKSKRKLIESEEEDGSAHEASMLDSEGEDNDAGPIGYSDEPPKRAGNVAVERDVASRKRADAGDKASAEEDARRRRKQELMDMMEEDGDGQADPPGE